MRRGILQEAFYRRPPQGRRLTRVPEDEVGIPVPGTGPQECVGSLDVTPAMNPAHCRQEAVVVSLESHADAVHAQVPEVPEFRGRDGPGGRLDGDLSVLRHRPSRPESVQDPPDFVGVEQAGGTAAEVDALDDPIRQSVSPMADFLEEDLNVKRSPRRLIADRHEVAVRTTVYAERDVNVEGEVHSAVRQ